MAMVTQTMPTHRATNQTVSICGFTAVPAASTTNAVAVEAGTSHARTPW